MTKMSCADEKVVVAEAQRGAEQAQAAKQLDASGIFQQQQPWNLSSLDG